MNGANNNDDINICESYPRRGLGPPGDHELAWFREAGITPEGDAPLASHTELRPWTAYVAWLLGSEAVLVNNVHFQVFCARCNDRGMMGVETARHWFSHTPQEDC